MNSTVYLKPMKGIGGDVDFNNPYTYQNLNPEEINLYINLEQTHLTKVINEVFDSGGLFEKHAQSQMERLGESFGEGYTRYVEGQALVAGGWYSAPIAPGIPVNTMTLAKVGGSIALSATLGPWAAFAFNAAFTTMEAAQGDLTWKQAAVQIGVSAVLAGASYGAGELGSLASEGLGGGVAGALTKAAITASVSTVANTTAGSIQYTPGGGFDFDKEKFTDNKTWSQAGLSFATSFAGSAATIGLGSMDIKNTMLNSVISGSLNTLSSNISVGGDGGWDWGGFSNVDWQKGAIDTTGSYLGQLASEAAIQDPNNEDASASYKRAFVNSLVTKYTQNMTARVFGREDDPAYSLDNVINVDTMNISLNESFEKMGEMARGGDYFTAQNREWMGTIKDTAIAAYDMAGSALSAIGEGIVNLGQSTSNFLTDGKFLNNEDFNRIKMMERNSIEVGHLEKRMRGNDDVYEIFIPTDREKLLAEKMLSNLKEINNTLGGYSEIIGEKGSGRIYYEPDTKSNGKTLYFLYAISERNSSSQVIEEEDEITGKVHDKFITAKEAAGIMDDVVKEPMQEMAKKYARDGYTVVFDYNVSKIDVDDAFSDKDSNGILIFSHAQTTGSFSLSEPYYYFDPKTNTKEFMDTYSYDELTNIDITNNLKLLVIEGCNAGIKIDKYKENLPGVEIKMYDTPISNYWAKYDILMNFDNLINRSKSHNKK